MKKPEEIKKVKDDPTCFECNHYEVCQMWSNAGYLHKDNPKKCSHFAGRSSERRKISTLQTIVDEQDKVIQQLEAQVPRWISVEERLPEGEDPVLILVKETEHYGLHKEKSKVYYCQYLAYWDDEEWYTTWCNGCRKITDTANEPNADDYEVTHWMPLPEAPKEDAQ